MITEKTVRFTDDDGNSYTCRLIMNPQSSIRALVSRVLSIHQLTPDLEQAINNELTRLGYLPEGDAEVLELLMEALDSGLVNLVPSNCTVR